MSAAFTSLFALAFNDDVFSVQFLFGAIEYDDVYWVASGVIGWPTSDAPLWVGSDVFFGVAISLQQFSGEGLYGLGFLCSGLYVAPGYDALVGF